MHGLRRTEPQQGAITRHGPVKPPSKSPHKTHGLRCQCLVHGTHERCRLARPPAFKHRVYASLRGDGYDKFCHDRSGRKSRRTARQFARDLKVQSNNRRERPVSSAGSFFLRSGKRWVGMFENTKRFDGGVTGECLNWRKRVARCVLRSAKLSLRAGRKWPPNPRTHALCKGGLPWDGQEYRIHGT